MVFSVKPLVLSNHAVLVHPRCGARERLGRCREVALGGAQRGEGHGADRGAARGHWDRVGRRRVLQGGR